MFGSIFLDLKALKRSEGKFGIDGSPREDNLFIWVSANYSCHNLCELFKCTNAVNIMN